MSNYELIALDMDGTLLNSQKKISKPTIAAIKKATSLNKYVVLSTGRGLAELKDYENEILISNMEF
ncbi:MAG: HAD hydrolase family protein [Thomasclavelia sp.]